MPFGCLPLFGPHSHSFRYSVCSPPARFIRIVASYSSKGPRLIASGLGLVAGVGFPTLRWSWNRRGTYTYEYRHLPPPRPSFPLQRPGRGDFLAWNHGVAPLGGPWRGPGLGRHGASTCGHLADGRAPGPGAARWIGRRAPECGWARHALDIDASAGDGWNVMETGRQHD